MIRFRHSAISTALFLVVIAVNGIYVFGVLPRVTAFEMLIAALMPTFVLFGWMAARPATARIGSMLAIYISVQLALNSSYSADFSSFANSSVALMLGVALTGVVCGIVRLLGASWIAGRLLRSNWSTLATAAERRSRGIASRSPASYSIAWPCWPRGSPWCLPRPEATPPIFASFERR